MTEGAGRIDKTRSRMDYHAEYERHERLEDAIEGCSNDFYSRKAKREYAKSPVQVILLSMLLL